MTFNLNSLRASWAQQSSIVEAVFHDAASQYAEHVANTCLEGLDFLIHKETFECAVYTRNRMLIMIARNLLTDIDESVKAHSAYKQYVDGLISSVECLNHMD